MSLHIHEKEVTMDIPATLLKRRRGFSIDFGASIIKLAYATENGDNVRFHFLSFPVEKMKDALRHFASKQDVVAGQKAYTCGLGCNEHISVIESMLQCRIINILERDCFVEGLRFLADHFPFADVVHPESNEATEYATTLAAALAIEHDALATRFRETCRCQMWQSSKRIMAEKNEGRVAASAVQKSPEGVQKIQYPILLGLCGSATQVLKVEEDGSYMCLDVLSTSGKTMMALSSLITGIQTFEELHSAAQNGCLENINHVGSTLELGVGDIYGALSLYTTVFALGKAAGKTAGDFRREDLSLGIVSLVIQTLVNSFHDWALITGVGQVFFSGGLYASDLVREMMSKYFAYKSKMNPLGKETSHYFIQNGIYLGVLGGLLKTLNLPSDPN